MLAQAIKVNDKDMFYYIIAKDPPLAHEYLNKFYSPLHLACEFGRVEFVKHLLTEEKVDLNAICKLTGYTPLMYACQVGNFEIV